MMRRGRAAIATAIQFLRNHGRLPEEPALQREQAAILFQTIRLYFLSGVGVSTLFMIAFQGWSRTETVIAYALIVLLYAVMFAFGLRWRCTGLDARLIRASVPLLFCLGCSWGWLVTLFSWTGIPHEKPALVGLAMALVSTPMLCVPLIPCMAFFLPVACACLVAVLVTVHAGYAANISFASYLVFATAGILYNNKTTMDRLVGRLNLQREHEIVRVFLREYEEVSTDWLWETDERGRLRNVAPHLAEALQIPAVELERVQLFDPDRQGDSFEGCDVVLEAMRARAAFRDRIIAVPGRAGTRWLNVTGHPVYDAGGEFQGYRGIGSDVTTAHLDRQRIEFLARHDGLTGLLSRRTFVAEADAMLAGRPEHALLLIDLDDFKQVNDDFGHLVGDALLETVARRLNGHLLPGELAARIGGDEFAMLIGTTGPSHAAARALELAQALRIELDASGSTLPASATIGMAIAPGHGTDTDQLMRRADLALYAAKNRGKGAACLFEPCMESEHLNRLRLLGELASAIEQDQIFMEYQPIVDIASGQLVSAEALVRWRHPTRGILTAGQFVLAAESSDLIEPLGEHVLLLACRAAMQWEDTAPVAVNLSPRQLRSGRFVPILEQCLAATGLPPRRLTLEVTETVFLDAGSRVIAQLDLIREMGVRLVLDDFGTGYSSLTYLHRFEVDGIKIDASFVRELATSRKVGAIVRSIGRLAWDMNVYVTAEGVETAEQLRWLRGNGIAFAQGYLLGRPDRDPRTSMAAAAALGAEPDATQAPSAAAAGTDAGLVDNNTRAH